MNKNKKEEQPICLDCKFCGHSIFVSGSGEEHVACGYNPGSLMDIEDRLYHGGVICCKFELRK